MRGERFNLEDQVGGLIDHPTRRSRRRRPEASAPEPAEEERYHLRPQAAATVRAGRASDPRRHRDVA